MRPTDEAMEFVASLLPMAVGSVDRLEEIPDRLRVPVRVRCRRRRWHARDVAGGAARAGRARGDRRAGRGAARRPAGSIARRFAPRPTRVKERTGQKGKALFHPIRVALTGEGGGPELDLAVPAIDRGAELPPSARPISAAGVRRLFAESRAQA